MNATTENPKLDVIRKLLAKAEGTDNPVEAETYTNKAFALMAQYGIDEALLEAKSQTNETPGVKEFTVGGSYTIEKAHLIAWLADALRCKAVTHMRTAKSAYKVTVVGFQFDLDRVELLYTSLLLQATAQLVHVRPADNPWSWDGPSKQAIAAHRRSWLHGFSAAVYKRVKAAERVAAEQTAPETSGDTSVALVLVDRSARVERHYEELFPSLRNAKRRSYSGNGYRDGAAAGEKADIGGKRVGGTRTSIGA